MNKLKSQDFNVTRQNKLYQLARQRIELQFRLQFTPVVQCCAVCSELVRSVKSSGKYFRWNDIQSVPPALGYAPRSMWVDNIGLSTVQSRHQQKTKLSSQSAAPCLGYFVAVNVFNVFRSTGQPSRLTTITIFITIGSLLNYFWFSLE